MDSSSVIRKLISVTKAIWLLYKYSDYLISVGVETDSIWLYNTWLHQIDVAVISPFPFFLCVFYKTPFYP